MCVGGGGECVGGGCYVVVCVISRLVIISLMKRKHVAWLINNETYQYFHNFVNFREGLYSRDFADTKFREK